MNQQREFINETFHVMAQPITALRATVELGLSKATDAGSSRQVLADCLVLIDHLMQDLAVFREIASLDEVSPLQSFDAHTLLQNCVDEMTPVAQDRDIALRLISEHVSIQCNQLMIQRAIFVLLDEMIASTPKGGEISLSLCIGKNGALLEVRPCTIRGPRQKLCLKLMQLAGGNSVSSAAGRTSATFKESSRHFSAIPLTDEQVLTSQESPSTNDVVKRNS